MDHRGRELAGAVTRKAIPESGRRPGGRRAALLAVAGAALWAASSVFCQGEPPAAGTEAAEPPPAPLRVLFPGVGPLQAAPHGAGNVYAPHVLRDGDNGRLRMWFGAQGADGHDRICLAESRDGVAWRQAGVVLEDATANHVNDPCVIRVGDTYWMFHTRAAAHVIDEIAAATSVDGVRWEPCGTVLAPSPDPSAWDSLSVGRPSVVHEGGVFRMWYDGRRDLPRGAPAEGVPKSDGSRRHVGYAESTDGIHWERFHGNPVFGDDAGGVDVTRIGDSHHLMLYESRDGTKAAISAGGIVWRPLGHWFGRSGSADDRFGHVTPHLFRSQGGGDGPIFYVGAAPAADWNRNRVGAVRVGEADLARILTHPPIDALRYADHRDLSMVIDGTGGQVPLRTPEQWAARRRQVIEAFESVAGPLPDGSDSGAAPVPFERLGSEERERHTLEMIRFPAAPPEGDFVHALLYLPKRGEDDAPAPGPAVLALHPTHPIGKGVVDGRSERPNRAYARELADRGFVVIAPDYPSFGDASGYAFGADGFVSGTMKGIWNHLRCVDLLVSLPEVDPLRIGVIGHSLGGHNAIFAALFDDRIRAVVTSCGWTPFHHYYDGRLDGWTSDRYLPAIRTRLANDPDRVPFDFPELIASLAPRAFFSSSPVGDDNFDVAGVRAAEPGIREVYRLHGAADRVRFTYPEAGHDFPDGVRGEAYAFLAAALASAGDPSPERLPREAR